MKLEDACIIFGKILEINPQDVDSLINLGIAYYELNKFDQALNYLNQAKDLNNRKDEVYFILALISEKNKNTENAIFNYNESIKYNSNNSDALINLGNIYLQNNNYDNAKIIS